MTDCTWLQFSFTFAKGQVASPCPETLLFKIVCLSSPTSYLTITSDLFQPKSAPRSVLLPRVGMILIQMSSYKHQAFLLLMVGFVIVLLRLPSLHQSNTFSIVYLYTSRYYTWSTPNYAVNVHFPFLRFYNYKQDVLFNYFLGSITYKILAHFVKVLMRLKIVLLRNNDPKYTVSHKELFSGKRSTKGPAIVSLVPTETWSQHYGSENPETD